MDLFPLASAQRLASLKANVSREEAIRLLSPVGLMGLAKNAAFGPLRLVAEAYLPLRLFRVEIVNGGVCRAHIFGLDAVAGIMDLYEFAVAPAAAEMVPVTTRNCPSARLDADRAHALVRDKVLRLMFSRGFFRVRDLRLAATALEGEPCIPYWLGFRGWGARSRFAVLDAVRRRTEGAKARALFHQWLLQ